MSTDKSIINDSPSRRNHSIYNLSTNNGGGSAFIETDFSDPRIASLFNHSPSKSPVKGSNTVSGTKLGDDLIKQSLSHSPTSYKMQSAVRSAHTQPAGQYLSPRKDLMDRNSQDLSQNQNRSKMAAMMTSSRESSLERREQNVKGAVSNLLSRPRSYATFVGGQLISIEDNPSTPIYSHQLDKLDRNERNVRNSQQSSSYRSQTSKPSHSSGAMPSRGFQSSSSGTVEDKNSPNMQHFHQNLLHSSSTGSLQNPREMAHIKGSRDMPPFKGSRDNHPIKGFRNMPTGKNPRDISPLSSSMDFLPIKGFREMPPLKSPPVKGSRDMPQAPISSRSVLKVDHPQYNGSRISHSSAPTSQQIRPIQAHSRSSHSNHHQDSRSLLRQDLFPTNPHHTVPHPTGQKSPGFWSGLNSPNILPSTRLEGETGRSSAEGRGGIWSSRGDAPRSGDGRRSDQLEFDLRGQNSNGHKNLPENLNVSPYHRDLIPAFAQMLGRTSLAHTVVRPEDIEALARFDPLMVGSRNERYNSRTPTYNHSPLSVDYANDTQPMDFSKKSLLNVFTQDEVLDFSRKSSATNPNTLVLTPNSLDSASIKNKDNRNGLIESESSDVLDLTASMKMNVKPDIQSSKKSNICDTTSNTEPKCDSIKSTDTEKRDSIKSSSPNTEGIKNTSKDKIIPTKSNEINFNSKHGDTKSVVKESLPIKKNCDIESVPLNVIKSEIACDSKVKQAVKLEERVVAKSDEKREERVVVKSEEKREERVVAKSEEKREERVVAKSEEKRADMKQYIALQSQQKTDLDEKEYRYEEKEFIWDEYLEETQTSAVPAIAFRHVECSVQSGFEKGMKLEIMNKAPQQTYWISTILMTCGQLLRMRPDGMPQGDSSADFWCDLVTSDVHQLGWAETNGRQICPPQDLEGKIKDWQTVCEQSLKHGRSPPSYMFSKQSGVLPIDQIKEGMVLEVQQKDLMTSVWPAEIIQNVGGRLLLRYIGMAAGQDFWIFYLDPRIHLLGWAETNECLYKSPLESIDVTEITGESQSKLSAEFLEKHKNNQPPAEIFQDQEEILEHGMSEDAVGSKLEVLSMEALNLLQKQNGSNSDESFLSAVFPATVTKILSRFYLMIRVDGNFEGDGSSVQIEYCCYSKCPEIFPVGWCSKYGLQVMNIPGSKDVFNWEDYLRETNSKPTSDEIFILEDEELNLDETMFESKMKLEADDPCNPSEIVAATIAQAKNRLLWLTFDTDESCTDRLRPVITCHSQNIYPIGWCASNNYPLKCPVRTVAIPIEKKSSESAVPNRRNSSEAERCALYQSLKDADAGKSGCWCPKIYFNYRCFTGPFLSKGRLVLLPQSVGPGPVTLVMTEVLSMLVSVAYKSNKVLKDLQLVGKPGPNMMPQILQGKYKGKSYSAPVYICTMNGQVDEFCENVCRKLKCCINLISTRSYSNDCPEACSGETKTKYTTYFHKKKKKKKKVGRPPLGEKQLCTESDDVTDSCRPGRKRRHRKIILSLRKKHNSATVSRGSNGGSPVAEEYEVDCGRRVNRLESVTWDDEELGDWSLVTMEMSKQDTAGYAKGKLDKKRKNCTTEVGDLNGEVKRRRMAEVNTEPVITSRTRTGRSKYGFDSKTHKKIIKQESMDATQSEELINEENIPQYTPPKFDDEEDLHPDKNPLDWSVDDVIKFIKSTDCAQLARLIKEQEIDGQSLLMLDLCTVQEHMIPSLGPAVKFCHQIERLKIAFFQYFT